MTMYDVRDVLPDETVAELEPGTSLLVAGPAMSGKRDLALDLLAAGFDEEHGLLMVTTTETAEQCVDDLDRRVQSLVSDRVGVVDCSGSSGQRALRDVATQRVSSPGDLTGISIGTAKLTRRLAEREVTHLRHGLVSVTTLLQYLELATVFKFLHIYTGRIDDTGGLGIFTLDNVSHDPSVVNTITSEFDGVVELRETDGGDREVRVRGLPGASRTWTSF